MNNYNWLVERLDAFIRKYYANKVIRGALVFLSCLLFYIITVSVSEYYFYLPVWSRITIMSLFVGLGASALVAWVIIPLTKMARLGSVISHEQAAVIIGTHFPEVSDKLLNILQLQNSQDSQSSRDLAEASINQKISQLSVVPMTSAIDLSRNRKYLPYVLPPLLAGIFLLIAAPNVFKEGSARLLQPTTAFEKPAPFNFVIKNESLTALRNSDFTLTMEADGASVPAEMAIEIGDERIMMQPLTGHSFRYTFKNMTEAVTFRFSAAGFYSTPHTIKVIQRPILKSFSVAISYPAYTGKKSETRNSLGDLIVPAGTTVSWSLVAGHTDAATIHFGSGAPVALQGSASKYSYNFRFLNDTNYTLTLHNNKESIADSFQYMVQVIPDQYPVIQLQQFKDSVSGKQILLSGSAGDDYGISRITFNYEVSDKNKTILSKSVAVKSTPGAVTSFEQYFDIQSLNLSPGQKVTYYIEAWDNDGVRGSKASRSDIMSYQMFEGEQLDSAINENAQQINAGISSSAEQTKQLQNDYKDAQNKMLQNSQMDWQMEQTLQQMMEKQKELKSEVEKVKERFEEQIQQTEQKNHSEDLKEKQQELNKQLNNLLNDELKKQMEKLQELMKKLNKEQAMDAMKELEQENKLFSMDMERMKDLMKKMELQMRMEDIANKMEDLAKEQRELKNETDQAKKDAGALAKEQKKLEEKLAKALQEDMKEVQKLAKETKEKDRLEKEEQQGKDAQQEMQESEQELDKKDNKKSGKAQDKAADNLEEMAKSMREKAAGMDMEQIELDIKATRQLLSNLIRLSFAQEDLMDKVRRTSTSSQAYIVNQAEQNRLHRNSQMIRDSLFELSKRIVKLAPTINKNTTDLERRMQKAVSNIEARRLDLAVTDQQYIMTHTNNLALLLNELLSNLMQMQNEGNKPGSAGSCKKPGGKKGKGGSGPQLSDIISEQQQLGEGMKKMQKPGGQKPGGQQGEKKGEGTGNGKQPGKGQSGKGSGGSGEGEDGENGEYGDSEQLAKLAQQQAAIRRQLSELASKLNSKGLGEFSKELRELEQKMDKNETDLVNRRMSPDLLLRQKEIQSRLLEAEKSLREQEQDDKRSSKTADETSRPVPPALQKYITDKRQMLEQYKTVPPQLKPYYRDMVENYFHIIGNK
jgi:hypothetical protein